MNLEDLVKEVAKEAHEELDKLVESVNTKTMPQDDSSVKNSVWWMQCYECNLTNALWQNQYDECNVMV